MTRTAFALLTAAAATLALTPAIAAPGAKPAAKAASWTAKPVRTEGGHRMGNPAAAIKLTEYMSYTCSHCAEFARTGDGAIKLAYVPSGQVSYEIRHLVRDPVDLTAALLTNCGPAERFFANHAAIMAKQPEWMTIARSATQAQQSRWNFGTMGARFQAIASDLGFDDIMIARGYTRPEIAGCLSDEAKASSIVAISNRDKVALALPGTPSFTINGVLLESVHDWNSLRVELDKRFVSRP